jgi:hypothetical protein
LACPFTPAWPFFFMVTLLDDGQLSHERSSVAQEIEGMLQHLDDVYPLCRTHLTGFSRYWVELMVSNPASLTAA